MKKIIIFLNFLTAAFIIVYWSLVFTKIFLVTELVPGYVAWFMSFPIADLWIAVCSLLAGFFLSKNNKNAIVFGIASGSALLFLGLYAFTYGLNTGLLFDLNANEIIEILIKVYCLSVGVLFIKYFAKLISQENIAI